MFNYVKKIIVYVLVISLMICTKSFGVYASEDEVSKQTITIHLAGDSTVKTYDSDTQMIGGWGEMLQKYFNSDNVVIKNYSQGGRSSRSFINEGRLYDNGNFTTEMEPLGMGPISESIQEGDYLIIQFGHNDDDSKGYSTLYDRMIPLGTPDENGIYPSTPGVKTSTDVLPDAYLDALEADSSLTDEAKEAAKTKALTAIEAYGDEYYAYDCGGTYKWFLKQYIEFARENGATPILVTPVSRRYFDENGNIESVAGHHGGSDEYWDFRYVQAVRQVAEEENVLLIDMFQDTVDIYEKLGIEDSQYIQSLKDASGSRLDATWINDYNSIIENNEYGSFDNTHQNKFGAFLFAGKMAEELKSLSISGVTKGIDGNEESASNLASYIYETPTSYVYAPDKLLGRLDDIANMFTLVKPIEETVVDTDEELTGDVVDISSDTSTVVEGATDAEIGEVNSVVEEVETEAQDVDSEEGSIVSTSSAKTGIDISGEVVSILGIVSSSIGITLAKRKKVNY